jgi:hypothetical protein
MQGSSQDIYNNNKFNQNQNTKHNNKCLQESTSKIHSFPLATYPSTTRTYLTLFTKIHNLTLSKQKKRLKIKTAKRSISFKMDFGWLSTPISVIS